jgi:hypothetical protein
VTFSLSGKQKMQALRTAASGCAQALYDSVSLALKTTVRTAGVNEAVMARIHTGHLGMNGSVLVALEQSMDDINVWMAPETSLSMPTRSLY